MEEHGYEQNNQERRKGCSKSSSHSTTHTTKLIAYEDTYVDGKHTRTTLGNSKEVEKLFFPDPLVFVNNIGLDHWNHGIAATKCDETDLKECSE